MPFTDTRGIFGPAGVAYSDGRYNDQNDYNTWTDPGVIAVDNGLNLATGLPFTRADVGFGSYTGRADANGRAEAARQAAANKDDGLGGLLTIAAIAAAVYTGGSSLGMFGGEALAGEGLASEALAMDAWLGVDAASTAAISAYEAGTVVATSIGVPNVDLIDSIGNFGDWIQSDAGTMYNPSTGEYLLSDSTYNAGSLGNIATGGADAYYDSAASFTSSSGSSLSDIFGNITKTIQSAGKALAATTGALQATRANYAQPNYTRAAGSLNLGTIALAAAAFLAFKG